MYAWSLPAQIKMTVTLYWKPLCERDTEGLGCLQQGDALKRPGTQHTRAIAGTTAEAAAGNMVTLGDVLVLPGLKVSLILFRTRCLSLLSVRTHHEGFDGESIHSKNIHLK